MLQSFQEADFNLFCFFFFPNKGKPFRSVGARRGGQRDKGSIAVATGRRLEMLVLVRKRRGRKKIGITYDSHETRARIFKSG